jgi:hypothetical protein
VAGRRIDNWRTLFERAVRIIDSCGKAGIPAPVWSFGGGTVLMHRYRHRISRDVDIFIGDPQYLTAFSPRLNDVAEALTENYVEDARFLKLRFEEGEIDFIVGRHLSDQPTVQEEIIGRPMLVETPREIIAKKVFHRASDFTARDLFDFALVIEKDRPGLMANAGIFRDKRNTLVGQLDRSEATLREDFEALDVLDYRPSFGRSMKTVRDFLRALGAG